MNATKCCMCYKLEMNSIKYKISSARNDVNQTTLKLGLHVYALNYNFLHNKNVSCKRLLKQTANVVAIIVVVIYWLH